MQEKYTAKWCVTPWPVKRMPNQNSPVAPVGYRTRDRSRCISWVISNPFYSKHWVNDRPMQHAKSTSHAKFTPEQNWRTRILLPRTKNASSKRNLLPREFYSPAKYACSLSWVQSTAKCRASLAALRGRWTWTRERRAHLARGGSRSVAMSCDSWRCFVHLVPPVKPQEYLFKST